MIVNVLILAMIEIAINMFVWSLCQETNETTNRSAASVASHSTSIHVLCSLDMKNEPRICKINGHMLYYFIRCKCNDFIQQEGLLALSYC